MQKEQQPAANAMTQQQRPLNDAAVCDGETFKYRLSARLITGLLLLITLILMLSFSVIWFKGRPLLRNIGEQSQTLLGQNVALALEQQLSLVAGISRSLAEIGLHLPKDEELVRKMVPPVLNQLGSDSLIAGGGIWPEPHAYQQGLIRRSFFWGRNASGALEYFDNYNDPKGPGYHNEEWYVPARLLKPGQVYWSRSYTDPYSLQPMVTCTAPMFQNGVFIGVATVDLKLDRVSLVLDRLVNTLDAYAFVVDRNNKFIAYPYPERVITNRDINGLVTPDYIYADELANLQPSFAPVAEHLAAIERKLFGRFSERTTDYMLNVDLLSNASYQIDPNEARRIAAHLWSRSQQHEFYPEEVGRFETGNDSLLFDKASVIVYRLPETNWKVITVFRRSTYLAITDHIALQLVVFISLATLVFGLVAYLLLRVQVLQPIRTMVAQLADSVNAKSRDSLMLNYPHKDELGMLAYWFNQRSNQLEDALNRAEKANQAKTAFLAKMSHEFRTPLNSIIGFSRRLQDKLKNQLDDFQYEAICRIYRNGHHLLELISDILDMAAIEGGNAKLRLAQHSANELLTEAIAECNILLDNSEIRLVKKALATDVNVECDKNKIIQVLVNLLSNAIKATRRGTVQIEIKQPENDSDHIYFEVSDTGVGISDFDKKKLFKKFTQLDSRQTVERGTGLGLFLVREFVALHKGNVTLNSELGVGTTVVVTLPVSITEDIDTHSAG